MISVMMMAFIVVPMYVVNAVVGLRNMIASRGVVSASIV